MMPVMDGFEFARLRSPASRVAVDPDPAVDRTATSAPKSGDD